MTHRTLRFELDRNFVLNANEAMHFAPKAKIISHLRGLSAEQGLEAHEAGEAREAVEKRLSAIEDHNKWQLMKRRARTRYKKGDGMTEKEIIALVDDEYEIHRPSVAPADIDVRYLYEKYNVRVTIQPPTRRRMDPPNLYPTVKALIDGLTDCAWWEDDDFVHQGEMSFRYGGVSGVPKTFILTLDVWSGEE